MPLFHSGSGSSTVRQCPRTYHSAAVSGGSWFPQCIPIAHTGILGKQGRFFGDDSPPPGRASRHTKVASAARSLRGVQCEALAHRVRPVPRQPDEFVNEVVGSTRRLPGSRNCTETTTLSADWMTHRERNGLRRIPQTTPKTKKRMKKGTCR